MNRMIWTALLGLAGCSSLSSAQTWEMTTASRKSPAEGQIQAKTIDNGNTHLKVKIKHVTWPNQIDRDSHVLVVWAKPTSGASHVQNLGAMHIDKDREAKLEAVTPFKHMQVFVTPEPRENGLHPTNDPVLSGQVLAP